jgi:hypothetical protein
MCRSGKDAVPSDAGVLGSRAVHTEKADRSAVPVGEVVVDDLQGEPGVGSATRERHEQANRERKTTSYEQLAANVPERRIEVH